MYSKQVTAPQICERQGCGAPIPQAKIDRAEAKNLRAVYCSDKCTNTAKQARYRARKAAMPKPSTKTLERLRKILPFASVIEWNPLGDEYVAWCDGAGLSLGAEPIEEAQEIAKAREEAEVEE